MATTSANSVLLRGGGGEGWVSGTKPGQITGVRRSVRGPGLDCVVFGGINISRLYKFTNSDQAQVILQLRVSLSERV